jgi:dTDP-4-dehydrorhamnose reductase
MRTLITGSRGTVGIHVCEALRASGSEVVGWDRSVAAPSDSSAVDRYVEEVAPEAIVHLAVASSSTGVDNEGRVVSVDWSVRLAEHAARLGVPYLFTSTAMVFTDAAAGPFTVETPPDATDGYGGEKADAERRVLAANPGSLIARLGWQIGKAPGSNNMIDFLHTGMERDGLVRASRRWRVSTSFLPDTAAALRWLLERAGTIEPGVYMIEGNRAGHSFFDIARALSEQRHGGRFVVEPNEEFVFDQRLLDERVPVVQVEERLAL